MEKTVCDIEVNGKSVNILSPKVGIFHRVVSNGKYLCPGSLIGYIQFQNHKVRLLIPENISGTVSVRDENSREVAVDFAQILLTLSSVVDKSKDNNSADNNKVKRNGDQDIILRSFITGIFYRSETPDSHPFVEEGTMIKKGDTLGLIEVMKSFNRIIFEGEGDFVNGTVEEIYLKNGAEVKKGEPVFRISVTGRKQ